MVSTVVLRRCAGDHSLHFACVSRLHKLLKLSRQRAFPSASTLSLIGMIQRRSVFKLQNSFFLLYLMSVCAALTKNLLKIFFVFPPNPLGIFPVSIRERAQRGHLAEATPV